MTWICWLCGQGVLEENCIKLDDEQGPIYLHWECFYEIASQQRAVQNETKED